MVNDINATIFNTYTDSNLKEEVWVVESGDNRLGGTVFHSIFKNKNVAIQKVMELVALSKYDYYGEEFFVDRGNSVIYSYGAYMARATLVEIQ